MSRTKWALLTGMTLLSVVGLTQWPQTSPTQVSGVERVMQLADQRSADAWSQAEQALSKTDTSAERVSLHLAAAIGAETARKRQDVQRHAETLLRLLDQHPSLEPAFGVQRLSAQEEALGLWVKSLLETGNFVQADPLLDRLLQTQKDNHAPAVAKAATLEAKITVSAIVHGPQHGLTYTQALLDADQEAQTPTSPTTLAFLSLLARSAKNVDLAKLYTEKARQMMHWSPIEAPQHISRSLDQGSPTERLKRLQTAAQEAAAAQNVAQAAHSLWEAGGVFEELMHKKAAQEAYLRAATAAEHSDRALYTVALMDLARLMTDPAVQKERSQALEAAEKSAMEAFGGSSSTRQTILKTLQDLYAEQGEGVQEAETAHKLLLAIAFSNTPDMLEAAEAYARLAGARSRTGNMEGANAALRAARALGGT